MWQWIAAIAAVLLTRATFLTATPAKRRRSTDTVPTMVVLGSGGHTAEMLKLLGSLRPERYFPRCFVIAATDAMGAAKAQSFEQQLRQQRSSEQHVAPKQADAVVEVISRSREVGQSYLTSVLTTLRALASAFGVVWRHRPELLLVNGPGTCIPICAAALLFRFFGAGATRIVYVESIARVASLSLSGLILYHCRATSAFYVQWPKLQRRYPRALYEGRLY